MCIKLNLTASMNKSSQVAKYLIFDFLAAAISWTLFFTYRKTVIEPQRFGVDIPLEFTTRYYLGLLFIPVVWLTLYYITGYYKNIFRRSRLLELGQTFITTLCGVIVIFFTLILDDFIDSYKNYYQLFFTLFALHFSLTYIFRLIITTRTIHRIHKREIGFNTLLIGNNENALKIYTEMTKQVRPAGNLFIGFVGVENSNVDLLSEYIPNLGQVADLATILKTGDVEEVIIALGTVEHKRLSEILTIVENQQITIWGIPDLYDFLSGMVKTNTIYGSPLIKISNGLMVPDEDLSDFKIYQKLNRKYTNRVKKKLYEDWDGYDYYDGELISGNFSYSHTHRNYPTVDHKISVYYGFINGIPAEEISDISNLCITKRSINSSKRQIIESEFLLCE